ncbi:hypothetical protein HNY73_010461 [Argiope bruennichi]|uniref:Uncharacterized protein n=1 Tax=Argiope bruennichi TaxID=94029 RepID=A0A8T0F143_ARGBR|nr:hypothetical protein HNY73_010461 [Argiope bruennichi]
MNIPPVCSIRNVASLREITLVSGAILISDLDKIKHKVEELHRHMNFEIANPEAQSSMTTYPIITETSKYEAEDKLRDICIPATLKKELAECVYTISSEIFNFYIINFDLMHEASSLKDFIVFNPDGSINHWKSHQRIIRETNLSSRIRFASACQFYSLDELMAIWNEVVGPEVNSDYEFIESLVKAILEQSNNGEHLANMQMTIIRIALLQWTDSMKPPLCQPYTGPHKVLKRTQKNFTIELNGRTSTVSIDRVKPAYLIPTRKEKTTILHAEKTVSPANFRSDKQQSDDKTVTTRSDRRVHFPSKLSTNITY